MRWSPLAVWVVVFGLLAGMIVMTTINGQQIDRLERQLDYMKWKVEETTR